jgi:hypothetical protein
MKFSNVPPRLLQSLAGASINGVINGVISWFGFRKFDQVPLSVDSIAAPGITAMGNAAIVAFALTFIFTSITFFVFRGAARKSGIAPPALLALRYWPDGLRMASTNTLLIFGGFVALAVLWQRWVGTVVVGPMLAALVVALVAMTATAIADLRTKREMLRPRGLA